MDILQTNTLQQNQAHQKLGVVLWVTLIVGWLNLLEQNLSSCVSGRKAKTHNKWRSRPKLWTFVQRIQLPAYTNSKAIILLQTLLLHKYSIINYSYSKHHTQSNTEQLKIAWVNRGIDRVHQKGRTQKIARVK